MSKNLFDKITSIFKLFQVHLLFKNLKVLKIKKMITNNDRVNGEFYLDNIFNHLTNKSSVFKVEKYFSWGTPTELKNYYEKI